LLIPVSETLPTIDWAGYFEVGSVGLGRDHVFMNDQILLTRHSKWIKDEIQPLMDGSKG
jgi:hypothetical protein